MGIRKLTDEDWAEARAMRANGFTLQEVADRFGVSKQAISKNIPQHYYSCQKCRDLGKIVYPGFRRFMMENRYTVSRLAKACGIRYAALYNALSGKHDPSKTTIDRMLSFTGMTYEEAFGKEVRHAETSENNPV